MSRMDSREWRLSGEKGVPRRPWNFEDGRWLRKVVARGVRGVCEGGAGGGS
jgi:hypothetical protein